MRWTRGLFFNKHYLSWICEYDGNDVCFSLCIVSREYVNTMRTRFVYQYALPFINLSIWCYFFQCRWDNLLCYSLVLIWCYVSFMNEKGIIKYRNISNVCIFSFYAFIILKLTCYVVPNNLTNILWWIVCHNHTFWKRFNIAG